MAALEQRRIVLGVSGSIAAYKSIYLLRLLIEEQAQVAPVLTASAKRFVAPLTFSTLAGRAAVTDLWSSAEAGTVGHVELAHWAELVVVAPATADVIARLALGRADDPLSAIGLATQSPIVLAPAMEDGMWHHLQTQEHIKELRKRGALIVAPEIGALASGRSGAGRLADPEVVVEHVVRRLSAHALAGARILVTAGPTREHFDPVRFISNPSSGRMGFALAREAARSGADVTLICGPVEQATPIGTRRIDVVTTQEMLTACRSVIDDIDVVLMAAAPVDMRPSETRPQKQKKGDLDMRIELERTPDILSTLDARQNGRIVVGFAAETEQLERYATGKLEHKNLDAVVGNLVGEPGQGFGTDSNQGVLFTRAGEKIVLPLEEKQAMARRILDWVAGMRNTAIRFEEV